MDLQFLGLFSFKNIVKIITLLKKEKHFANTTKVVFAVA